MSNHYQYATPGIDRTAQKETTLPSLSAIPRSSKEWLVYLASSAKLRLTTNIGQTPKGNPPEGYDEFLRRYKPRKEKGEAREGQGHCQTLEATTLSEQAGEGPINKETTAKQHPALAASTIVDHQSRPPQGPAVQIVSRPKEPHFDARAAAVPRAPSEASDSTLSNHDQENAATTPEDDLYSTSPPQGPSQPRAAGTSRGRPRGKGRSYRGSRSKEPDTSSSPNSRRSPPRRRRGPIPTRGARPPQQRNEIRAGSCEGDSLARVTPQAASQESAGYINVRGLIFTPPASRTPCN